MNQHMNQELLWKSQTLNPTTENIVKSRSDCKRSDGDVQLTDFINIIDSYETYDCSANGNSFDDNIRPYHGSDKVNCDRSTTKEYKNYNDIEPGAFVDGIYGQNRSFTNPSMIPKQQSFPDGAMPMSMVHQYDQTINDGPMSRSRHSLDQPMTDEYLWFYLDPRSNVQGPFLDSQMFAWWSQGIYFQSSLLMRRKCDVDFSTLQDYSKRFNGVPFGRRDIRVGPLPESLSLVQSPQSSSGAALYRAGPAIAATATAGATASTMTTATATTTTTSTTTTTIGQHQPPSSSSSSMVADQGYLLQLLSSVPAGHSTDELSKLLHKATIQQRIQPLAQGGSSFDHIHQSSSSSVPGPGPVAQNGTDGPSSLSNFVNLRLGGHSGGGSGQSATTNYGSSGPPDMTAGGQGQVQGQGGHGGHNGPMYLGNDRYQQTSSSSSWTMHHQQQHHPVAPKLTDSVWMSTSNDTILSSNPAWTRSSNDPVAEGPSLLNSIFQDKQHKTNSKSIGGKSPQTKSSTLANNPMQETWDNLDPAIIKMVPLMDGSGASTTVNNATAPSNHSYESKSPRDIGSGINQTEQQQQPQRSYTTSSNNPSNNARQTQSHNDTVKYPWADLVRKGGNISSSNQKSKSTINTEPNDTGSSLPISPSQHKTSLTSSSSDEYDQHTSNNDRRQATDKDVDSLIKWSTKYLENRPGVTNVDIGTLVEMLIYVESPYEVEATMRENVPEFDSISDFVRVFIEKRRPLRQRLFLSSSAVDQQSRPATVPTTMQQPSMVTVVGIADSERTGPGISASAAGGGDNGTDSAGDDSKWQIKSRSHHGTSAANNSAGNAARKKRNKNSGKN